MTARTELFPLRLRGLVQSAGDFKNRMGMSHWRKNTSSQLATPSFGSGPARCQQAGATIKCNNTARKFYGLCRALVDTKKPIIYSDLVCYKGKPCPLGCSSARRRDKSAPAGSKYEKSRKTTPNFLLGFSGQRRAEGPCSRPLGTGHVPAGPYRRPGWAGVSERCLQAP